MPQYLTPRQIARAQAAGAGNGPGQTHVDDWISWDQEQNGTNVDDYGDASTLLTGLDQVSFEGDIEGGGKRFADVLRQAQRYDPNAKMGDNNLVQMDRSKLPQWAGPQVNQNWGKDDEGANRSFNNFFSSLSENNAGDRLLDPTKVIHDENYGDYTMRSNLKQASNDQAGGGIMGQLQTNMPMIIQAIMAAGMGAGGGPLMGGMMGSAIGPGGIGDKLAMGQDVDWKKVGINAVTSAAGSLLPPALSGFAGASGLDPSTLADIMKYFKYAKTGYNLYDQINKGRG